MRPFKNRLAVFAILLAAQAVWAGGSGLNVIVVVNQNSTNSVQLGNDYCELRGVPPQNLFRMTGWTGGSVSWSPAEFQNYLLNPLLSMIASRGLTNQAEFVLLSMEIPYRVTDGTGQNSTTSALFYGFKTNTVAVDGIPSCSLPDNSSNSYACSEMPFDLARPNTATTNSFLAMMLTDTSLAGAESVLRRSAAADGTFPTQTVWLAKTTDSARNVRFVEFDNAIFDNQVVGNYAMGRTNTNSTAFTNILGLQTGLANFSLRTNAFVPGALGDSLTSYGGDILENGGQTTALAFLNAGASGSYGTVVEPCNWTQKFPDPMDYFYQTRGFSVAEAYYQSLLNPFQGLLVGEPLAAPFARPANAEWDSLTNGTVLSGQTTLNPVFTAVTNLPLARVDLFVDGMFFQTMTNLAPTAGNVLTATVNGHAIHYTVPTNAALAGAASGLAEALNLESNVTRVMAIPAGDRIEMQSLALSVPGSNVTVTAGSDAGSASNLTTHLTAARPTFLDTIATGYEVVTISNTPIIGDWLQFTFVKTNGDVIVLGVTNTTSGTTVGTLAQNLMNLINTTPALQSADGVFASDFYDNDPSSPEAQFFLYARTAGWPASQIMATLTSSTNLQAMPAGANPLANNVSDLRPRDHLYLSSGVDSLPVDFALDTTRLPDGFHELTAVAYEGTSVATQTHVTRNVQIQNTGLTATLAALPVGTNATLDQQLQFTITANTPSVSRIELFGTGGSLGVATNQSAAVISVSAGYLGLGTHPFYALVTDQNGNRYRTETAWYDILPTITLALIGSPPTLIWPAIPGRQYDLQATTNLAVAFQTVATILATNSILQWPAMTTGGEEFYRVQLNP
ncbi:MAG TPA: TIGR03790 family protein [Verrucomicrobiae bacterium]|nr:TIGR03790 family protein [Verrucomicrobiae bacterium]